MIFPKVVTRVVVPELISHFITALHSIVVPLLPVIDAASTVVCKPFSAVLTVAASIGAISLTVRESILATGLAVASGGALTYAG